MIMCTSLFRGINVGGRHKVRMEELKALHAALGLGNVATYIQSGNVVFSSEDTDVAQLQQRIEDAFAEKFGFRADVMVRTASQIQAIIEHNPFQDQSEKEPQWIVVLFLATPPESMALQDLRDAYKGPEEFHLVGQELYMYYPDGIGRSKLTNALLEKKLQTRGTARNWNTVLRLQNMMQG